MISTPSLGRVLSAIALPIACVGLGQTASASVPPSSPPASDNAPSLPEGYVPLVDDTGLIQVAVPETWTDTDTAPATNEDGIMVPSIAASTDLRSFTETFEDSGVRYLAVPYESDPQVVIDKLGLSAGCETIEIEPYTDFVFSGLLQIGTNCGANGGTWNMVVASPPDQAFTAVVQVQAASPADEEAVEIVLLTFNSTQAGMLPGASVPGSSTPG